MTREELEPLCVKDVRHGLELILADKHTGDDFDKFISDVQELVDHWNTRATPTAPLADEEAVERIIGSLATISVPDDDGSGTTRLFVRMDHVGQALRAALARPLADVGVEKLVERAVETVNARFPDWKPSPAMLGYARAVAKALAEGATR